MNDRQAAPIDEGAQSSSINQIRKDRLHPFPVKREKLRIGHLSGGRRECPVRASGDILFDRDIEGLVGQNKSGDILSPEPFDDRRIGGSPADQAMSPKPKMISCLRVRRACRWRKISGFQHIFAGADDELSNSRFPPSKEFESVLGPPVSEQARGKLRRALQDAGVEFIDENGGGPGVRLRKSPKQKR
jgi:hypothetical protein